MIMWGNDKRESNPASPVAEPCMPSEFYNQLYSLQAASALGISRKYACAQEKGNVACRSDGLVKEGHSPHLYQDGLSVHLDGRML